MLNALFEIVFPVFAIAGIGFAWVRSGRSFATAQFTPIITYIGTPALVLSALVKAAPDIGALGLMVLASILLQTAAGLLGYIVLKLLKQDVRAFLPPLMFANTGNMGLPLCLLAFGDSGLALAIGWFTVSAIGHFTVGYAISAGGMSIGKLLRTPLLYAVAIAIFLILTGIELPTFAFNTLELLGRFTIPLMLLALGASLATIKIDRLGLPSMLAVVRVGGGLTLGLLIVWLLGLEGEAAGVVIIQASMPAAVFNYLFAQLYDRKPEEVAALVVTSTALAFAILPVLLPLTLP